MHRILFHAGLSPLDRPPLSRVFQENLFTNNSGNLLFQYGAYRTLMTEDVRITTAFFERLANGSKDDAARINETYDCAVMPMASRDPVHPQAEDPLRGGGRGAAGAGGIRHPSGLPL